MSSFVIRPLNAAGHVTAHPMPPLVREDWSYLYLLSGEVLTEIDGQPHLLAGGDCLLIPPGLRYCVKYFRDTVGYMGAFSEDLLRNSGHRVLRLSSPSVLSVPVLDKVFFDELMIRLMRFSSALSMVQSLLDVLLCQFDLIVPEAGGSASSKLCNSYLERVFDRSVQFTGVAGYASALGVSPNHLNRAVKAETGRSASVWIDNARVSLARELLLDRSMSMSEIAERLGFSEASYFSRFFRKVTGVSPSEFRG